MVQAILSGHTALMLITMSSHIHTGLSKSSFMSYDNLCQLNSNIAAVCRLCTTTRCFTFVFPRLLVEKRAYVSKSKDHSPSDCLARIFAAEQTIRVTQCPASQIIAVVHCCVHNCCWGTHRSGSKPKCSTSYLVIPMPTFAYAYMPAEARHVTHRKCRAGLW